MSDIQLTAAVDFTGAKKDVDSFVKDTQAALGKLATETAKVAKSLSAIRAASNAPGGSNSRPGTSSTTPTSPTGRTAAVDAYNQLVAQERRYQAALSRTDSMIQRIDRQGDGNAQMIGRARSALDAYTTTLRNTGTRSLETARAHGTFAREMGALNSELARTNGLLPNLSRGFSGTIGAINALGSSYRGAGAGVGVAVSGLANLAQRASAGAEGVSFLAGSLRILTSATALTVAGVAAVAAGIWTVASATTEAHDKVSLLTQRFAVLAGSAEAGQTAFASLVTSANQMGIGLEDGAQAFSRFILAGREIGITTKEATGLADTFLKLGRIGGSTTSELQSGLTQFGQALASGRLQGDEFRSMTENMPLILSAIAKELGTSTGALKTMASEGKITADVMTNALANAAKDVDAQFAQLPRTASAMATEIQNEWTLLLADLDTVFGGSTLVKNVYGFFRDAVKGARAMVAPSDDQRATDLEAEIAKRRKNIEDRNNSFWKSPAFDAQDRQYMEQAERELAGIRKRQSDAAQKEREADLQAALQQELNIRQKGQQTIADVLTKTDPVAKAAKERDDKLSKLTAAHVAGVDETQYAKAMAAVNTEYDEAIDRINKRENALSREERTAERGQKVQNRRLADLDFESATLVRLADANLKGANAYAEVSRQIETESRLRELNRQAKEAGIDLDQREAKAKLDAADAAQRYNDAAAFARNLVTETATPTERATQRMAELQRNYDELVRAGKPIPKEIETAFERAKTEALSANDVMAKAFKSFATSAEHFPANDDAEAFFDAQIKEALQ